MKNLDAYRADTLTDLIKALNQDRLQKENIVSVFTTSNGEFIAVFEK